MTVILYIRNNVKWELSDKLFSDNSHFDYTDQILDFQKFLISKNFNYSS